MYVHQQKLVFTVKEADFISRHLRSPSGPFGPVGGASGAHQRPEDWEDSGSPQDEQPSQGLGVVGLHHFDNPQQSLNSGSPQVTHVEPLQVHQARPAATQEEGRRI